MNSFLSEESFNGKIESASSCPKLKPMQEEFKFWNWGYILSYCANSLTTLTTYSTSKNQGSSLDSPPDVSVTCAGISFQDIDPFSFRPVSRSSPSYLRTFKLCLILRIDIRVMCIFCLELLHFRVYDIILFFSLLSCPL